MAMNKQPKRGQKKLVVRRSVVRNLEGRVPVQCGVRTGLQYEAVLPIRLAENLFNGRRNDTF